MREPDDAKVSRPVLGGAGGGDVPMPTQHSGKFVVGNKNQLFHDFLPGLIVLLEFLGGKKI